MHGGSLHIFVLVDWRNPCALATFTMKIVKPFLENDCHKCGYSGESKIYWAGPHVKQVCEKCGFYIRFIPALSIPSVREIKEKIWFMTDANIDAIQKAKIDIEFIDGCTGTYEKVMYFKLYLNLRSKLAL